MQPIIKDEHGTLRFRTNAIVRVLLEHAGVSVRLYNVAPHRRDA